MNNKNCYVLLRFAMFCYVLLRFATFLLCFCYVFVIVPGGLMTSPGVGFCGPGAGFCGPRSGLLVLVDVVACHSVYYH